MLTRAEPATEPSAVAASATVEEVVWSLEMAEAETARLNELDAAKGCLYVWQYTRVRRPPTEPPA
jgi:hypothetical protein